MTTVRKRLVADPGQSWYFVLTIVLSAFLLFQIQPLIGKYFLPWFGGGSAVWTTCMLFFQVFLLGGYLYAHAVDRLPLRLQGRVHAVVIGCTCLLMIALSFVWKTPVTPGSDWRPSGSLYPVWSLLRVLFVSVGLPYFLLSTTSTLMQIWFSRLKDGKSPYVLYVMSNIASLFALVSYPILFEPLITVNTQALLWACIYGIYILILGYCTLQALQSSEGNSGVTTAIAERPSKKQRSSPRSPKLPASGKQPPAGKTALLWLSLAACASVMLLATTNQLCQDVAAIPFLWVLPLSLYLLTFIIGFNEKLTVLRHWYPFLLAIALFLGWWNLEHVRTIKIGLQVISYGFILFVCCLVCHSELYHRKPHPRYLSSFYLMLSVGGAIGGVFVSLIAPILFKGFWEYHVALMYCAGVIIGMLFIEKRSQLYRFRFLLTGLLAVLVALICYDPVKKIRNSVAMSRNFYGVMRVREALDEGVRVYGLMHGSVFHGMQWSSGPYHTRPTDYFTETSGGGLAILNHPKRLSNKPLRVGIIGLGIGTLAAYGEPGDSITFYEIDPDVLEVARNDQYFTYLSDCQAEVDVVLGDARLSLERELSEGSPQGYDIFMIDAFTSDAIPAHLLTKEAFEIYLSHLNHDGVMAVHITNRHIDLAPVLHALAQHFGLKEAVIESVKDSKVSMSATWTLLSRNSGFMNNPAIQSAKSTFDEIPEIRLWTDDYSNLYQVLR